MKLKVPTALTVKMCHQNQLTTQHSLILLCILSLLMFAFQSKANAIDNRSQVLILSSWQYEASWHDSLEKGIVQGMESQNFQPSIYREFLDAARFADKQKQSALYNYLNFKYQKTEINFVVAEGVAATQFIHDYPDFFSNATKILIQTGLRSDTWITQTQDGYYEISASPDFDQSINTLIQTVNPEKLIVIADESHTSGKLHLAQLRISALKFAKKLKIEYLINEPLKNLLEQTRQLPKDSAIFYLPTFVQSEQIKVSPYQLAQTLSLNSNVPIFTHWQQAMGSGILGGYMLSSERLGETIASTIMAIQNQSPMPMDRGSIYQPFFDQRQLQRWQIGQNRTDTNATVFFQEPNIFNDYLWEFVVATLAVITFGLIALFALKSSRNSKAELERIESDRDSLVMLLDTATRELVETKIINEQLAQEDELSGLRTRRAFIEQGESVNRRARRYNQVYCLLTLDIDHFKNLNETYGHTVGDEAIRAVADLINETIRKVDIAGRVGSEEFAVILPYTSAAQGKLISERVREKVTQINITAKEKPLHVTISVGITENRKDDDSIDIVLERAFDALHEAKEQGHNRVKVA